MYKYLGVLETDQTKHEMKDKVKTEYLRRVQRVLQSKLNGGNTISAINTWAVSLVRYTAGITNWRKDELEAMCRMCKNREETVTHIISECSKLAQLEYKKNHDKVDGDVHWSLLKHIT